MFLRDWQGFTPWTVWVEPEHARSRYLDPEGSKHDQHLPELSGDPEHGNSGPGGPLPASSRPSEGLGQALDARPPEAE